MSKPTFFKSGSLLVIWVWLTLFALFPTLLILVVSFLQQDSTLLVKLPFGLQNYIHLVQGVTIQIFLKSFEMAGICALCCLLIGYPFAYLIAQHSRRYRSLLLLMVIIPFWTSSLIRTYAILAILKANGLINHLLMFLGIIQQPLQLLYTSTAVLIGLVYDLLPFMILPLYVSIEKLDHTLVDAARDLGASKITIFLKIIIPLTMSGILAGVILVFLPAMTLFFVPVMLGGAKSILLGNLIQNQFLTLNNWPMGAATSICLLGIMTLLVMVYWRNSRMTSRQELM